MSQSCFSLGFLSQNSLWKLSTFCGYKGYLYWCVFGMRRVSFSQTEWIGNLASRLDWVASPSHELTEWPYWTFYPIVLQLAWLFSFYACFTRVHPLATCKPRASHEIRSRVPCWVHNLELFFTLSHTLLLHDSYLNTVFLSALEPWEQVSPEKQQHNMIIVFVKLVIHMEQAQCDQAWWNKAIRHGLTKKEQSL